MKGKCEKLPIKYCTSSKPYCNARIKGSNYSLCCRYGWCEYAQPSQNRGRKTALPVLQARHEKEMAEAVAKERVAIGNVLDQWWGKPNREKNWYRLEAVIQALKSGKSLQEQGK